MGNNAVGNFPRLPGGCGLTPRCYPQGLPPMDPLNWRVLRAGGTGSGDPGGYEISRSEHWGSG
eukprot:8964011-Alexandrium_andersonii.AAC.2